MEKIAELSESIPIEMTPINITMIITGLITITLMIFIGFCFMYKIQFEHRIFGPSIFIYTYHIGSFHTLTNTLNKLLNEFKLKNGLIIISQRLKLDIKNVDSTTGGIYYDDPKTVKSDKLRSAVGILITLPKLSNFTMSDGRKILKLLKIENCYLRILPKSNYLVSFYPLYFGMFSYMIGAMRTYPEAAKQNIIKAPPIELFKHSKISQLNEISDNMISYLFIQNNLESLDIDIDMARPNDDFPSQKEDKKASKQEIDD